MAFCHGPAGGDREDATIGLYTFDDVEVGIAPGNMVNKEYNFADVEGKDAGKTLDKITLIEVQPFVDDNGKEVYCRVASQKIGDCW